MSSLSKWKRWISPIVGAMVSCAALWLTFRNVDFSELVKQMHFVSLSSIIWLSVVNLLFLVLRAYRWHILLKQIGSVPIIPAWHLSQIGGLANNLLPLRIGEVVRAMLLKRRYSISGAQAVGNIVLERLLDLIALLLMLVAIMATGQMPHEFEHYGIYAIEFVVAVMVIVLVTMWVHARHRKGAAPRKDGAGGLLDRVMTGLSGFKDWRTTMPALVWTFVMWLLSAVTFVIFNQDLPIEISVLEAISVTLLIAIGITIPAAPGFVGTYHLFCKIGLVAYGVPEEQAIIIAFVTHFMTFFWTNFTGAISMVAFRLHWRDLFSIEREAAQK